MLRNVVTGIRYRRRSLGYAPQMKVSKWRDDYVNAKTG